jgi:hypothetical protein
MARKEERRPRPLDEWDYLVGVSDVSRLGALRIRAPGSRRFLSVAPIRFPPLPVFASWSTTRVASSTASRCPQAGRRRSHSW